MKTPTAVLLGFLMVSVAVVIAPLAQPFVISAAKAQGLDPSDFQMIERQLERIVGAIHGIRCR